MTKLGKLFCDFPKEHCFWTITMHADHINQRSMEESKGRVPKKTQIKKD